MKITRVEAIPVELPLQKPMLMAGRRYSGAQTVFVRVETTGRHIGWGEASVAPFLTGETIASILAAVSILADAVVERDPRNLTALAGIIDNVIVGNPAAKAAVDVAIHDAVARQLGIPLYRLLGGLTQDQFPCLWLIGNSDKVSDIAEAEAKAVEGFRCFKLKVANGKLSEEADTLVNLRRVLGPNVLLCADANAGWSASQAIRFVRLAEPAYPEFLEQPVASNDFDGMARVAGASTIPVGADEGIHALQDVRRLILSGAAAGGSFKIMKLGGISRCMAAIRLCTALGGSVNISGKLGESSLANAATLALAAAVGQPRWGLSLTHHYLADDVVRRPLSIRQGIVRPLDGPGLGVELDEAKLSRFQIACATGLDHRHQPEEVRKAEAPTA